jgi:hypothetical protein
MAPVTATNPGPTLYGGPAPTVQPVAAPTVAAPTGGILASAQPSIPQGQQPNQPPQPAIQQAEFERIDPNLRTVQTNETVMGQLQGILASNSPLLQQARARAAESMQGRGLLNSSIAVGAGEDAAIGRALEIAVPDAATYAEAAKGNQQAINDIARYNQAEFGETSRTNAGFVNRRGDINVQEQGLNQRQQVTEKGLGDRLLISEAGDTARQNSVNQTNITTTGMNNATSVQTANISADTARYGYQLSAATQRDVAQYNAESAAVRDQSRMSFEADQNMQSRVQQIVTNPDMTQEYRDQAIRDIVAGGRATHKLTSSVSRLPLAIR